MIATLHHIESIADQIETRWFAPDKPFSYVAGQFVEVSLPHANPDDRGEKRWFTLSSSPTEDLIAITTKFTTPKSSFKNALHSLQIGDCLTMSEPMGDFVLPRDGSIPIVFIAGGIGITPMRSMLKWLSDTGEKRSIHLLYSVTDMAQVAFKDIFEAYKLPTQITLQKLDAASILKFAGSNNQQLIYLSGPEPMIESLHTQLIDSGTPAHRLVEDYFPGYTA